MNRFGTRIVYDAESRIEARPIDYVKSDGWRPPAPMLNDLIASVIDRVEWVLTTGKEFSIRSSWNAMRVHYP